MRSRSEMRQFKKKKNEPMNWKRRIKVVKNHKYFFISFFLRVFLREFFLVSFFSWVFCEFFSMVFFFSWHSKMTFRAWKVQIRSRLQNQRAEKANRATRARDSRQSRTNSRDGVWIGTLPQVKHTARTGAYRDIGFFYSVRKWKQKPYLDCKNDVRSS